VVATRYILQPQPPLRNLPVATPGCNNPQPNTTQVATNSYNHLALELFGKNTKMVFHIFSTY
jgi:hypothetical protein